MASRGDSYSPGGQGALLVTGYSEEPNTTWGATQLTTGNAVLVQDFAKEPVTARGATVTRTGVALLVSNWVQRLGVHQGGVISVLDFHRPLPYRDESA